MTTSNNNSSIPSLDVVAKITRILWVDAAGLFFGGIIFLFTALFFGASDASTNVLIAFVGALGVGLGLFAAKLAQGFAQMKHWTYEAVLVFLWSWFWLIRELYSDPVRRIFELPDPD